MKRITELQAAKRILFNSNGMHGNEKIGILNESIVDAYKDLDIADQRIVRRNKTILEKRFKGIGRLGSLELLSALSDYIGMESE